MKNLLPYGIRAQDEGGVHINIFFSNVSNVLLMNTHNMFLEKKEKYILDRRWFKRGPQNCCSQTKIYRKMTILW